MTSRILDLVDDDGNVIHTAWVRTLKSTGRVIYCGNYTTADIPGFEGRCLLHYRLLRPATERR
jgi:hypothetical protein